MRRQPSYFVRGFTVLISTLFYFSSVDPALFYLDRMAVWQGDLLRLVSGHLMHTDLQHWALNTGVFAILGGIIEQRSRGLLLAGWVAGICAVDLWLVSPWASIQVYCGLSGVLNTLFVLAAGVIWQRNPHRQLPVLLIGAGLKIVVELYSGVAVLSATSLVGIVVNNSIILVDYTNQLLINAYKKGNSHGSSIGAFNLLLLLNYA